jgi:lysophospholipase L1-like esterase
MFTMAQSLSRPLFALLFVGLLASGCKHVPPPNSLASHDSSRWENDIRKFEEADRTARPPKGGIEFVGSSSIRLWKTLQEDFPDKPVFNRGFGGSQLADSANFADRIIIPYAPRQVVIFAGTNDINDGKTPEMVFGDFVALVTRIHQALPRTEIAYIAISPAPSRWSQVDRVRAANRLIAQYCKRNGFVFINTFPLMLGEDGQPKPDIFVADKLHLNAKGYAIWRDAVAPHLTTP